MPTTTSVTSQKTATETTCFLMKDLYDCVRNRPFNKPFTLVHEDGSVDNGLKTEQEMKEVLWQRQNPFLQRPVTFKC